MTLTDAQKAALAELNEGKSICFGSASTTYNKQEIIAEGLEIADFALMVEALELRTGSRGMKAAEPSCKMFLDRCEEVVIEWLVSR